MSEWKVSGVLLNVELSCKCIRRVAVEVVDIKDVFRALKTTSSKLRVKSGVFGSKIRDAQTGGDASPSNDHDVLRLLKQRDSIINCVVLNELLSFPEFTLNA